MYMHVFIDHQTYKENERGTIKKTKGMEFEMKKERFSREMSELAFF